MTSNDRRRRLAKAKYERQQERRRTAQHRRRVRQRVIAIAVVVVVIAGAVAWVFLGRTPQEPVAAEPTPAATISATPPAVSSPTADASPSAAAASPVANCGPMPSLRPASLSWPSAPPLDGTADSDIVLDTNCGQIGIRTLAQQAPATVASERFLVQQGFYDGTTCHRVVTEGIYALQCGDPEATGTGGPGYFVPDENLPAEGAANYPAGTVAMANAGPGTSGSQFFIVYQDTTLPPAYTVWGEVVSGLDVVQAVAAQGVLGGGSDGPPAQPIGIETATVGPAGG